MAMSQNLSRRDHRLTCICLVKFCITNLIIEVPNVDLYSYVYGYGYRGFSMVGHLLVGIQCRDPGCSVSVAQFILMLFISMLIINHNHHIYNRFGMIVNMNQFS